MTPFINLTHLKFFCDAVTNNSISEAAKINYVSQSAVSQAITKLEAIFGSKLIGHSHQKLQVTDEGRIVYLKARNIFKSVQETFDLVHQTKEEIVGTVKFYTTKSLGMSFLAPMYKQIKQNLPRLDLDFRMGGLNVIRTALKKEEVEFAVVVFDHNFDQFSKLSLKKGRLNLYQSKEAAPDLLDQGVFVDEFAGLYVKELQQHFDTLEDPTLKIQATISGWELVARFTELNIGVGFFPDYIVANNRFPEIEHHPLKIPSFEYEICAIYNKSSRLSRNAQAFLNQFTLE